MLNVSKEQMVGDHYQISMLNVSKEQMVGDHYQISSRLNVSKELIVDTE